MKTVPKRSWRSKSWMKASRRWRILSAYPYWWFWYSIYSILEIYVRCIYFSPLDYTVIRRQQKEQTTNQPKLVFQITQYLNSQEKTKFKTDKDVPMLITLLSIHTNLQNIRQNKPWNTKLEEMDTEIDTIVCERSLGDNRLRRTDK